MLLMRITLATEWIAEINVPGLGHIAVNGADRILHPVNPRCSEHIIHKFWYGQPEPMLDVLDAIENTASVIFPKREEDPAWFWNFHDVGDPNLKEHN